MGNGWRLAQCLYSGREKRLVATPSPDNYKMMILGGVGAVGSVEECVV